MSVNGFKVIDSDLHCMEPPDLWERYLDPPFKHRAPKIIMNGVYDWRYVIEGKRLPYYDSVKQGGTPIVRTSSHTRAAERFRSAHERGWTPEVQLEAMEAEGLDMAVIYPTIGLFALALDDIESGFAAAIARAYNNWLYDFCQANPQRLLGAAMLAPHSVEDAVLEARRSVREIGFKGVFLRPNLVHGRNWHDSYYEPLWAELEALDVPMGFHEGASGLLPQTGERFGANRFMRHVSCHPMEMMLAAISMCGGGVLERYPRLRVAFLEANCGWLPWLLDRMDGHYEIEWGITAEVLPQKPSVYFKRQCFVSAEADERFVKHVVAYLGDNSIVFSTDWPHPDAKYPRAVRSFLENDIPDVSKRKILWENCARFYGLSSQALRDSG